MRLYNDFWDRFIPALKEENIQKKYLMKQSKKKEMFYDEEFY